MSEKPKQPAERPDVTAARDTLTTAQADYDALVKASKRPQKDPKAFGEKLTAALAAKQMAAVELDAAIKNLPAPKAADVKEAAALNEGTAKK